MELTTQCPHCKHKFGATVADLQRRKGFIRCERCAHIFDGFEEVVPDDAPPSKVSVNTPIVDILTEPVKPVPVRAGLTPVAPHVIRSDRQHFIAPSDQPIEAISGITSPFSVSDDDLESQIEDTSLDSDAVQEPVLFEEDTVSSSLDEHSFYVSEVALGHELATSESKLSPTFNVTNTPVLSDRRAHEQQRPVASLGQRSAHLFWSSLLWLLIAVLLAQLLYVFRNQVANQFPITRPALESMCTRLGCQVSYERRINQIKVVSSSLQLQSEGSTAGGLYNLRIRLRNDYRRAQEWPTLIITFTDISTAVISRIELPPQRYLLPKQQTEPFGPFDELEFTLPVDSRTKRINGYKIDKYYS